MKKILILIGICLLAVVVVAAYLLTQEDFGQDLVFQKDKIESELALAKKKLTKEKETLENLTDDLRNSFPLAFSVQDQMKKSLNIVHQTDFMFTDANGSNPALLFKNLSAIALLNKQRQEINLLLAEWQNKTSILFLKKIDAKESEQIRKDAEAIKKYLRDLTAIVRSLTPQNSGISQFQIYIYTSNLPSEQGINEVLLSLQVATEEFRNNPQIAGGQNADSSSGVHVVTPEEVLAQQGVVGEVQSNVASLQEQLTQIERQIQETQSPSIPTITDTNNSNNPASNSNPNVDTVGVDTTSGNPSTNNSNSNSNTNSTSTQNTTQNTTDTTVTTNPSDQNPTVTNSNNPEYDSSEHVTPRNFDKTQYQGIIIQPGPPELIQGDNQY